LREKACLAPIAATGSPRRAGDNNHEESDNHEEDDPVIRRKHLDELRRIAEHVNLHKQFLYRAALFDSLNSANAVE
jgi:hypothetical protein